MPSKIFLDLLEGICYEHYSVTLNFDPQLSFSSIEDRSSISILSSLALHSFQTTSAEFLIPRSLSERSGDPVWRGGRVAY